MVAVAALEAALVSDALASAALVVAIAALDATEASLPAALVSLVDAAA